VKWKVKATSDGDNMGDQDDLPLDQHEEVQQKEDCQGASRAVGRGDRGDQRDDVESSAEEAVSKEEVEQKRTYSSSREAATTTTKQRSRWTAPERSLGSRRISTVEQRSS
jgi:hypothetical protein